LLCRQAGTSHPIVQSDAVDSILRQDTIIWRIWKRLMDNHDALVSTTLRLSSA
jgi:hypothetical protein